MKQANTVSASDTSSQCGRPVVGFHLKPIDTIHVSLIPKFHLLTRLFLPVGACLNLGTNFLSNPKRQGARKRTQSASSTSCKLPTDQAQQCPPFSSKRHQHAVKTQAGSPRKVGTSRWSGRWGRGACLRESQEDRCQRALRTQLKVPLQWEKQDLCPQQECQQVSLPQKGLWLASKSRHELVPLPLFPRAGRASTPR